jgi:hypothetical protein
MAGGFPRYFRDFDNFEQEEMTRLRQMGDAAGQSEAYDACLPQNSACNAIRESQLIFRTDLFRYDYVFGSHWIHEFDSQIAIREESHK